MRPALVLQDTTSDSDTDKEAQKTAVKRPPRSMRDVDLPAAMAGTAAIGAAFLCMWAARLFHGWKQDRQEDNLDEAPEVKQRRGMIRNYRHTRTRQQQEDLMNSGQLGPDLRNLFQLQYNAAVEREMRQVMPGGKGVWSSRRERVRHGHTGGN